MNRDEALMQLYQKLVDRHAPPAGAFSTLSEAERREYYKLNRRHSRARAKAAAAAGTIEPNLANIRDALADAALMILATDAPGADQVRTVLAAVFAKRPGVPMNVEQRARNGRLRPKLAIRRDDHAAR